MPGRDLSQLKQAIHANGAEFSDRARQFSARQVQDPASSPQQKPELPTDLLRKWLETIHADTEDGRRYLDSRSGAQLERGEAEDLREILHRLRNELNRNLLGNDSPFAQSWPDDHEGLRGETEDLERAWNNVMDAVNPYCQLLRFRDEHPEVGTDNLSKARQHYKEIQQDSREIFQRFMSYTQILLAMVKEVTHRLPKSKGEAQ